MEGRWFAREAECAFPSASTSYSGMEEGAASAAAGAPAAAAGDRRRGIGGRTSGAQQEVLEATQRIGRLRRRMKGKSRMMCLYGCLLSSVVILLSFLVDRSYAVQGSRVQGQLTSTQVELPGQVSSGNSYSYNYSLGDQAGMIAQYAGYFSLPVKKSANIFYFYVPARKSADTAPLIIWLNGGPGCGSEFGLLLENGPFNLQEDGSLKQNPYGWDTMGNILYIDQPVNVGFSYSNDSSDKVYYEAQYTTDLYDFLQTFMLYHPELKNREIILTGESYAGHYLPALALRMQGNNILMATPAEDTPSYWQYMNITGIALLSPLIDPLVQFNSYYDYALAMNMATAYDLEGALLYMPDCLNLLQVCYDVGKWQNCSTANDACSVANIMLSMTIPLVFNEYDIRQSDNFNFDFLETYLNQPSVQQALGVSRHYKSCNNYVRNNLWSDIARPLAHRIPSLLSNRVRVLVMYGQYDYTTNYIGQERWMSKLKWSGTDEFNQLSMQPLNYPGIDGDQGETKNVRRLTAVRLNNAGHLLARDQPQLVQQVMQDWLKRTPFPVKGSS